MADPKTLTITNLGSADTQPASPARYAWERMPGEPNLWFDRFEIYRLLDGAHRSITVAWRAYLERAGIGAGRHPRGIVPGAWVRMEKRWNWKARAAAWDDDQRQRQQQEWTERRETLREREWKLAEELMNKAQQMLVFPLAKTERKETEDGKTITTVVTPTRWTLRDAGIIADVASKLARLAAEMRTGLETVNTQNIELTNKILVRDQIGVKSTIEGQSVPVVDHEHEGNVS